MSKEPWDPPFVEIEWIDADADSSWTTLEEVRAEDEDTIFISRGWVVSERGLYITLVNTVAKNPTDHTCGGTQRIPKVCVLRRVAIKNPGTIAVPGPERSTSQ